VGCYIISDHPELLKGGYTSFRGKYVVEVFCDFVIKAEEDMAKILETNISLQMTEEDKQIFKDSQNCYYCEKHLGINRVRVHNHLTGKFRGAAHNRCNLFAKQDKFVPLFFHNLSGYDAHLFIKTLAKKFKNLELIILAKNSEDYISFQFGCLRFLDSCRFHQSSLDNITKSMPDEDFKITRTFYPNESDFKLLRKKGSVPYSFYKDFESFEETSFTYEMFYDELTDEMKPEKVYQEAKEFWKHFNIQNHGQFIDLYLRSDVLLFSRLF
jgi:hypothetical protein